MPDSKPYTACRDRHPEREFICTLDYGHEGDHQAWGVYRAEGMYASWPVVEPILSSDPAVVKDTPEQPTHCPHGTWLREDVCMSCPPVPGDMDDPRNRQPEPPTCSCGKPAGSPMGRLIRDGVPVCVECWDEGVEPEQPTSQLERDLRRGKVRIDNYGFEAAQAKTDAVLNTTTNHACSAEDCAVCIPRNAALAERARIKRIIEAMPNLEGPTRGRRAVYMADLLAAIDKEGDHD